jgi:hydrogenase nickel incorporation protein HypB
MARVAETSEALIAAGISGRKLAVVTKGDMASAAGFDRKQALENLNRVSHHARIFELSAKTGDGMKPWLDFLADQRAA